MPDSPFHDPQRNPLPDANDIEQAAASHTEPYSPQEEDNARSTAPHIKQDIQKLRNIVIWLLVIGAALGCVVGAIIIIILKRTGLIDPPQPAKNTSYDPYRSELVTSSNLARHTTTELTEDYSALPFSNGSNAS